MAVVGSAEVIVRAITNKVKDDIQKAFRDARPAIAKEGESAGKAYSDSFGKSLNSNLSSEARNAARNASQTLQQELGKGLDASGRSTARSAGKAMEEALTDSGRRGGKGFVSEFINVVQGDFTNALNRLFNISSLFDILAPSIALLIGMVSSLASGLFAMGSAAASAAGAIAVLPGLLGAAAQAFGAIKLGFGGVSDAIKAGAKAQTAAAGGAAAARKAAGSNAAATRALQKAQDALTQAQKEARAAQDALNAAQDRAKAGLEEQQAAERRLAAAQQARTNLLSDPNASAAQGADVQKSVDDAQQAATAIARSRKEAQDDVLKAAEKNDAAQKKLAAAQAARDRAQNATKAGGISTPAITAAQKYQQALSQLTPEAQAFVAEVLKMRAAFKEVGDAIAREMFPPLTQALQLLGNSSFFDILKRNLSTTGAIVGDIGLKFAQAFTTKTNMQRFSDYLAGNNDILDTMTTKTRDGITPVTAITNLLLKLGLAIQPLTKRFAEWAASMITAFDAAHSVGEMTGFFNRAGDSASQLGSIFGNLFGIIGALGKAARPAGQTLLDSFEEATGKLEKFLKTPEQQEVLKQFFADTADNMRSIGNLVNAIGKEFFALGDNKGIGSFAEGLIPAVELMGDIGDKLTEGELGDALANLAVQMAKLIDTFTQTGQMKTFIDTLSTIVEVISNITGVILKFPGAGAFLAFLAVFRATRFAASILGFSKSFDKLRAGIVRLIKLPFRRLKKDLNDTVDPATAPARKLPVSQAVVEATNPAVVPVVGAVGGKMDDAAKKSGKLAGNIGKLGGAFKGLGAGALALVGGPVGALFIAIPLLIAAFSALYKKSPEFRKFVNTIVKAVKPLIDAIGKFLIRVLNNFFGWVNDHMPQIKKVFSDVFGFIGNVITKVVVPVFKFLVDHWRIALSLMLGPLGIAIALITKYWDQFKFVLNVVMKVAGFVFKVIKGYITNIFIPYWKLAFRAARTAFNGIRTGIGAVRSAISVAFGAIKKVWNAVLKPVFVAIKNVAVTSFRGVRSAIGLMGKAFGKAKDVITEAKDGLVTVFNAIKSAAKKPIKWVIDTVWNKGLVSMADKIPGVKAGGWKVSTKGWATGGWTGPGGKYKPAGIVHADEFVVKKASRRAVEKMHPGLLDYINRMGRLPGTRGYADGGRVTQGHANRHKTGYPWADWAGDFPNAIGTPVWAWKKGVIKEIHRWSNSYGNHIRMNHTDGTKSLYAHLSRILVKTGQKVSQGSRIGAVGWSGNVRPKSPAGSHLHFEKQGAGGGFINGKRGLGGVVKLGGKVFDWAGDIVKGGIKWTAGKAKSAYNGAKKLINFITKLPSRISKNMSSAWGKIFQSIPKGAANKVVDKVNSIVPHQLPLIPIKHPFGNVDFRASGGRVRKGSPYVVGELRPELFIPDSNGTIMPNLSRLSSGDQIADILKALRSANDIGTPVNNNTTNQTTSPRTVNVNINNPAPERASQSVAKSVRSKAVQHGWGV